MPVERNTGVKKEVLSRGNGFFVEARHYRTGSFVSDVVRCETVSSQEKLLGNLKCIVNKNTNSASLNAICKIHSNCCCWISSVQNSDLLLQWLQEAQNVSKEEHQVLSKDLKRSIGMKIRK